MKATLLDKPMVGPRGRPKLAVPVLLNSADQPQFPKKFMPQLRMLMQSDVFFDPKVQRGEQPNHIRKIIRTFDGSVYYAGVVSERPDGRYSICDGLQRSRAGYQKYSTLPWLVYKLGDTDAECRAAEANFFGIINGIRLATTTISQFLTSLTAGATANEEITAINQMNADINRIVKSLGFSVNASDDSNTLACVKALQNIFKKRGIENLETTLTLIQDIWHGNYPSLTHKIVTGFSVFLDTYCDSTNYDRRRLIKAFVGVSADEFYKANVYGSGHADDMAVIVRAILRAYNDTVPRNNPKIKRLRKRSD